MNFTFEFIVLSLHFMLGRSYYKASRGLVACGFFHFVVFSMWNSKILSRLHTLHYASERTWVHYFKLWFFMVLASSLLNFLRLMYPVIAFLLMFSSWIPQIAYNAKQKTCRGSPPEYVVGATCLCVVGCCRPLSDR
eukprot:PhF_6_TR1078/c2_g1_i1/m.2309